MAASEIVIGLDLGALNGRVAVFRENTGASGAAEVIPNDLGERSTACCCSFTDEEEVVGGAAKNLMLKNPKNTISTAVSLLGLKFSDAAVQQSGAVKVSESGGQVVFEVTFKGKTVKLTPVEIVSRILKDLRTTAQNFVGEPVKKAVVTVQRDVSDAQKEGLVEAAKLAGLEIVYFMNAAAATAVSMGLDKPSKEAKEQIVVVIDVGNSTEVTVVSVLGGLISLKGHARANGVGGAAIDTKLLEHFAKDFKRKTKSDLMDNPKSVNKLLSACVAVKHTLSNTSTGTLAVESLYEGADFESKLNRGRMEMTAGSVLKAAVKVIGEALTSAGVDKEQIDQVVMVGGCSRIPKLQTMVKKETGKEPIVSDMPEEAAVLGAALQGQLMGPILGDTPVLEKVLAGRVPCTSNAIGLVAGETFVPLIPRGSPLPCTSSLTLGTSADNQTAVYLEIHEQTEDGATTKLAHLCLDVPSGPKDKTRVEASVSVAVSGALEAFLFVAGKKDTKVTVSVEAAA